MDKKIKKIVEKFVNEAGGAGYTALQGAFHGADSVEMYEAGMLPDANDFNVGHPYMLFSLPAHPQQEVPNTTPAASKSEQLWASYRLCRDEAIVFIGMTPPLVDYFSMRSYLFWRFFPERCAFDKTFVSLGDTLNNKTIAAGGDDPCNQLVAIVSTASVSTFKNMKHALKKAGVPPGVINCDEIPQSLVKTGIQPHADQLTFLCRFGNFTKRKDRIGYVNNKDDSSGVVFRLTPMDYSLDEPQDDAGAPSTSVVALGEDCFPPKYAPRGSGNPETNELRLLPVMRLLRQKILERFAPSHDPLDLETDVWIFEGADALQRGIDAFAEDRDTTYLRSQPFTLAADEDEFAIVYGLNHQAFGKVTYNSFGVYDTKTLAGVCSQSSYNGGLGTGASVFLADTQFAGVADKFYVYRIGRKDPNVKDGIPFLQVPYTWGYDKIEKIKDNALGKVLNRGRMVPVSQEMFVGFRAYLDNETTVGPAWWEMIYDRVIVFKPYS